MSEAEFNEKYLRLTRFQQPVLIHFLLGSSDAEIATKLKGTKENIRQHISKMCQLFEITDRNCEGGRLRECLVEEFRKYKPELLGGNG